MVATDARQYDYLCKVIIVGDAGAGKSSLLHRLKEDKFDEQFSTIGVEFRMMLDDIEGKKLKIHFWDTAGQETFKSVTRSYFNGANYVLFVYDVTNRLTFAHLNDWIDEVITHGGEGVYGMILGTKADLGDHHREVTFDEGRLFAEDHGLGFMEISSKTGENVADSYKLMLSELSEMTDKLKPHSSLRVTEVTDQGCTPGRCIIS